MSEQEQQSVANAVNSMARTMRSQLEGLGRLFEAQIPHIEEAINRESDEYNELLDKLELTEEQLRDLELKHESMVESHTIDEMKWKELETELNERIATLNVRMTTFNDMRSRLNEYKKIDVNRLQSKNSELRKTAKERLDDIVNLRKQSKEHKTRAVNAENELSVVQNELIKQGNIVDNLRSRLQMHDGDVVQKVYRDDETGIESFIYLFNWQLNYKPTAAFVNTVNDLDFHIEIRTNRGVCLIISPTDWGVPIFPNVSEIEPYLPKELSQDLQELYLSRFESSHPYLIDRIDWAKGVLLEDTEVLSENDLAVLEEMNCTTVYELMHVPYKYVASASENIDEELAKELQRRVRGYVSKWEAENWTLEQRGIA